jgi:hypothetical protein
MLDISHSCHFSDGGLHTLLLAPSLQVCSNANEYDTILLFYYFTAHTCREGAGGQCFKVFTTRICIIQVLLNLHASA